MIEANPMKTVRGIKHPNPQKRLVGEKPFPAATAGCTIPA